MNIVDSSGWLEILAELQLPMADSMILAAARAHGATLWTQDQDFEGIEGVRYLPKPSSPP